MKFSTTLGAAAALAGMSNAQNMPKKVSILTPREGSSIGVSGFGWMIDVVAEFSGSSSSSGGSSGSGSGSGSSSGGSGGYSYKMGKRATNLDDGFFPFLNSPNLTSFAPGLDPAAPGFVCLVNTSSDPTQNFAGVFQLNAITNSDSKGNILEGYYSWYVGADAFGSDVFAETTVFFLNDTAPAKYTKDPKKDPAVISNVATANFFINGKPASNATSTSTMKTPLSIDVFTPRAGEVVGVNGSGWMIDMVIVNNDPKSNFFAPANGYKPLYHDNFTDSNFVPAVPNEAVPGLVVLSNTSSLPGGGKTNLANLFQINAVTSIQNGIIMEYWCTWFIGKAFAGTNEPSDLTIFMVNGTAPDSINSTMPTNIVSDVVTVNFTLSGAAPQSTTPSSTGGSGTGAASTIAVSAGAMLFGLAAFLF